MNRLAGTTRQFPAPSFGQSLPRLAIAGGIVGHRRQLAIFAVFLEALQGVATGMIGRKDLSQEHIQSDPWGIDPGPPSVIVSAAGRLDLGGGQDIEERKPCMLGKMVPECLGL